MKDKFHDFIEWYKKAEKNAQRGIKIFSYHISPYSSVLQSTTRSERVWLRSQIGLSSEGGPSLHPGYLLERLKKISERYHINQRKMKREEEREEKKNKKKKSSTTFSPLEVIIIKELDSRFSSSQPISLFDEIPGNKTFRNPNPLIDSSKTAISRNTLSLPMQILEKEGYLDGAYTILDYGCGKGEDVSILKKRGVSARCYDPHFFPTKPKRKANIVNLGYVLNVMPTKAERRRVLKRAFDLATDLLVVTVRTGSPQSKTTPYKDGIVTTRDTFQKYYTQAELINFVKKTLKKPPISVRTGVVFVKK